MTKIINLLLLVSLILSCKSESSNQDFYGKKPVAASASEANGKKIYDNFCVTCHMSNGQGVEKVFPPLAGSDYLMKNQQESIKSVKYGMSGEIVVNGITYNSVMAPLGLSDKEVADVMNYINNAWGNKIDNTVTEEIVSKIKK